MSTATTIHTSIPREMTPLSALKAARPAGRREAPKSLRKTNGRSRTTPSHSSPSVTLVSMETLPSYSSGRSYLLSELEQYARETLFLEEEDNDDDDDKDQQTLPWNDSSTPQFVVLYLQWHASLHPEEFMESILLYHVQRLLLQAETASAAAARSRLEKAPQRVDEEETKQQQQHPSTTNTGDSTATSPLNLYIVVDRVEVPPVDLLAVHDNGEEPDDSSSSSNTYDDEALFLFHLHQEDVARSLAKQVAMHDMLRSKVQGITVGVSNQERAAPGLDACAQVCQVGNDDRFRFGSAVVCANGDLDAETTKTCSSKSLVSIVATSADTLLGWHPTVPRTAPATTASNIATTTSIPLDQFRVVAEWNAQGNLQTFGQRAHAQWRRNMGLWEQPLCLGPARRPVPRTQQQLQLLLAQRRNMAAATSLPSRNGAAVSSNNSDGRTKGSVNNHGYNPAVARRMLETLATNAFAFLLLGFYLWFHYRNDILQLYMAVMVSLVDFVSYLRAL